MANTADASKTTSSGNSALLSHLAGMRTSALQPLLLLARFFSSLSNQFVRQRSIWANQPNHLILDFAKPLHKALDPKHAVFYFHHDRITRLDPKLITDRGRNHNAPIGS